MPQTDDTMHVPASRGQLEEAVRTLMRTLQLHPDAPVVPGGTDRPGLKELLLTDLSNAIEAKRPSTFALPLQCRPCWPNVTISPTEIKFCNCWTLVPTR